jgi:probable DNA repair protein
VTEFPLISRSEALDAAERGATLLTPNRRLAAALKAEFDAGRIAAGRGAWPAPDILPWGAWLSRALDEARHDGGPAPPRLLTALQERALWESAIAGTPEGNGLLAPAAAAAECAEAWSLAHQWDLLAGLGGFPKNEDAAAFIAWSGRYASQCAALGATDSARLPALCAELAAAGRLAAAPRVVACGFDRLAPAQRALLEAWRGRGVEVAQLAPAARPAPALRLEFVSAREELAAAAQWARARLAAAPGARIAIVVPDLAAARSRVIRALTGALVPAARLPGGAAAVPFNLSLGLPLADWPLVHGALALLSLARGALELGALGALLRSPFIAGAQAEAGARARLDARLREIGELEVDLGAVLALAGEPGPWHAPLLARALRALREARPAAAGRRPPSAWGRAFLDWLRAAGFPGERGLSSAEFQTLRSWREALASLASLDAVTGRLGFDAALGRLRRIAADTVFQPESRGAPVQVLGLLEAAGQDFDHLWVTGLSDEAWPPAPRPNPFLPAALQRRHDLPGSSAAERLAFARRLTAGWLAAAPEVVLSSPRREDDRELGVSPLLLDLPRGDPASLGAAPVADYRREIRAAADLTALEDWQGPALAAGALLPGGTAVFADQAACPFRAFAAHRLGAAGIKLPEPGLDALERGSLVHGVLARVWKRLGSQDALRALDEAERLEIVTEAARQALARLQPGRARTLSGRFLALEQGRLAHLARDWLQAELARPPFEVAAVEEKRALAVGGLAFNARLDRVDRLPGGRALIIDYKTGKTQVSDWLGGRPGAPQLPLYCVTAAEEVAGIAFAQVRAGDMALTGLARDGDILPDGRAFRDTKHAADYGDWEDLLAAWRRELERLAAEFASGRAPVDPKDPPRTCEYCEIGPLCRIAERLGGPPEREGEAGE